jgi:hypothetical protein
MRHLILVSVLLFPAISLAANAPWCLVRDENEKCTFISAEACYARVTQTGGSCRENYVSVGVRGDNQWCVVTGSRRDCKYRGQRHCLNAAQQVNGGCVRNIEKSLEYAKSSDEFVSGEGIAGDIARELEELNQ